MLVWWIQTASQQVDVVPASGKQKLLLEFQALGRWLRMKKNSASKWLPDTVGVVTGRLARGMARVGGRGHGTPRIDGRGLLYLRQTATAAIRRDIFNFGRRRRTQEWKSAPAKRHNSSFNLAAILSARNLSFDKLRHYIKLHPLTASISKLRGFICSEAGFEFRSWLIRGKTQWDCVLMHSCVSPALIWMAKTIGRDSAAQISKLFGSFLFFNERQIKWAYIIMIYVQQTQRETMAGVN